MHGALKVNTKDNFRFFQTKNKVPHLQMLDESARPSDINI